VYEPPIRPVSMTGLQRREFMRKAKADSLAYDAAQLLSRGEAREAASLAGECIAITGREQLALWLRHYATTRFKLSSGAVEEFLRSVPDANVAL